MSVVFSESMSSAAKFSLKAYFSMLLSKKLISRVSKIFRKSKVTILTRDAKRLVTRKGRTMLFKGRNAISWRAFMELQIYWREPFTKNIKMQRPRTRISDVVSVA